MTHSLAKHSSTQTGSTPTLRFVAKALVLDEFGNALLLRRTKQHSEIPLAPDLPGGNLEPGEQPLEAVCREITEETGLQIQAGKAVLLYVVTNFYHNISWTRYVYAARVSGTQPAVQLSPEEHDSAQWLPFREVVTAITHPMYHQALVYLLKHNLLEILNV